MPTALITDFRRTALMTYAAGAGGLPAQTGDALSHALPTPAGLPSKGPGGMPSMPSVPSSGGGGGGSPLSSLSGGMGPLQGLMGGGKGLTGPLNNISPAALQGGPASGAMSPASLGSQFGRGMAAGAGAAGAMPMSAPAPQAPSAPLAAPISPAGGAPLDGRARGGADVARPPAMGRNGFPGGGQWWRARWRHASDVVVRVGAAPVGDAAGRWRWRRSGRRSVARPLRRRSLAAQAIPRRPASCPCATRGHRSRSPGTCR